MSPLPWDPDVVSIEYLSPTTMQLMVKGHPVSDDQRAWTYRDEIDIPEAPSLAHVRLALWEMRMNAMTYSVGGFYEQRPQPGHTQIQSRKEAAEALCGYASGSPTQWQASLFGRAPMWSRYVLRAAYWYRLVTDDQLKEFVMTGSFPQFGEAVLPAATLVRPARRPRKKIAA